MKEFAKIALDIDRDSKIARICQCCEIEQSQFLYLIKSAIYGIFHVCYKCKMALMEIKDDSFTRAFVVKEGSTYTLPD